MAFVPYGISSTKATSASRRIFGCSTVCPNKVSPWVCGEINFSTPSPAQILSHPTHTSPPSQVTPLRMELGVGSDLPAFSLPTSGGGTLTSDGIAEGPTILYFYPRDATPGCTTEAKDFRDMMPLLKEMGVTVVGVSKDSVESHDKFVKDLDLPFPLISDDGTLVEAFGVWKMRKLGPIERMGIERSTFIVKGGKIVKEWRGVKSGGHAAKVFDAVKEV